MLWLIVYFTLLQKSALVKLELHFMNKIGFSLSSFQQKRKSYATKAGTLRTTWVDSTKDKELNLNWAGNLFRTST